MLYAPVSERLEVVVPATAILFMVSVVRAAVSHILRSLTMIFYVKQCKLTPSCLVAYTLSTPLKGMLRAIQFSFLSPFRKGGWGDFGTPRAGKSPLAPLCKGGNGAYHRKLNDPEGMPKRGLLND
jgi:hypothetical protein